MFFFFFLFSHIHEILGCRVCKEERQKPQKIQRKTIWSFQKIQTNSFSTSGLLQRRTIVEFEGRETCEIS